MRIGRSVFAVGWRTDAGGAPTTCPRSANRQLRYRPDAGASAVGGNDSIG